MEARRLDPDNDELDSAVMDAIFHVVAKQMIVKNDGLITVNYNDALKLGDKRVRVEFNETTSVATLTLEDHPQPVTNDEQAKAALRQVFPDMPDELMEEIFSEVTSAK